VDLKDQQDGDGPHHIEAKQAARCGFPAAETLPESDKCCPKKTHVFNLCMPT
jgi:hypothetical protein